ncbi:MAG TPA: AbrB/MazE/SpoVT family DNA-binding domain-containing protein [Patescibacteria group bacterium]|nr:AbrB/MazE/SpoVT family DNA-binding domain-containing protein [Patescibacteria group bacterium]
MNLTTITKPNSKGQIVIPKKFRQELNIDENVFVNLILRSDGVLITPLNKSTASSDSKIIFQEILRSTSGAWKGDNWKETEKKRRKTEIQAAKSAKSEW